MSEYYHDLDPVIVVPSVARSTGPAVDSNVSPGKTTPVRWSQAPMVTPRMPSRLVI